MWKKGVCGWLMIELWICVDERVKGDIGIGIEGLVEIVDVWW